jgi:signal transduction histidine kinase
MWLALKVCGLDDPADWRERKLDEDTSVTERAHAAAGVNGHRIAGLVFFMRGLRAITRAPPHGRALALAPRVRGARSCQLLRLGALRWDRVVKVVEEDRVNHISSQSSRGTAIAARAAQLQELADRGSTRMLEHLKTPLSSILVETHTAEDRLGAHAPAAVRHAVQRITQSAHRMERLVGDLLDLADARTGRLRLARQRTDLARLLAQLVKRGVSPADHARIELEVIETAIVNVDPARLERVIAMLIDNALRRSAPATPVHVRLDRRGERAAIGIADHGPALTPEQARAAFELECSQAGAPLYVAAKIVEAHGGQLAVESVPGKGSRYALELPIAGTRR